MVKRKNISEKQSAKGSNWAEQLCALLTAGESLAASPILGPNPRFAKFLKHIIPLIERLGNLNEDEFYEALKLISAKQISSPTRISEEDDNFQSLSLGEVEQFISDPTVTKQQLLTLVKIRFRASTGTLSRLSRSALIERIETFIMNEQGHVTLARLASEEREDIPPMDQSSESFAG